MSSEEVQRKIMEWNVTFPLDKWYREKYSIPLFSEKHLNTNPLDVLFEFLEIKLFQKVVNESEKAKREEVGEIKEKEDSAFERLRQTIKNGEWTSNIV